MAILATTAASALIAVSLPTIAFAEAGAETPPDVSSQTTVEATTPDAANTSTSEQPPADPAANPDPAATEPTPEVPPAETPPADAVTPPVEEVLPAEPLTTEGTDPPTATPTPTTAPLVQSREAPSLLALAVNEGNHDPVANGLKFVVKKGGARSGASSVSALPGATFELYQAANTQSTTSNDANRWATTGPLVSSCVTDNTGMCYLYTGALPTGNTSANQLSRSFIVREVSAPADWTAVTSWGSGVAQTYAFKYINKAVSGNVAARTLYAPSSDGSNQSRSWPDVYKNTPLPNTCGLKIAVVMDLSGSVSGVGGGTNNLPTYKAAAKSFVSALAGTPTLMSLFTFASQSPAAGASNINVLNKSLNPANGSGRTAMDTAIDGLTIPNSSSYYTNWDAAFQNVLNSGEDFDAVLFMTDGDPTTYGTGGTTDTSFLLRNVEEAIHSANAVKQSNGGTHVMAIGIGGSVNTTEGKQRLAQISSPTDYFTTGFDTLGQTLKAIASKACAGNLVVAKQIVGADGTVTNAAASGWEFNASDTGAPGTVSKTTDGSGAVSFPIDFSTSQAAKLVTANETVQSGYVLYPQSGNNAVCTVNGGGAVTGYANVGATGFKVNVGPDQTITCTIQNQQTSATVKVNKQWVIKDAAGDIRYQSSTALPEFGANLTLSKTPSNTPVAFGKTHTGFTGGSNGDVVTVGETGVTKPTGCTADSVVYSSNSGAAISAAGVTSKLNLGANEYTITNTFTCATSLTLKKALAGGLPGDATVDVTDWTLTATKPEGMSLAGPSGVSGSAGATAPVTPGMAYALTETPGANAATKLFNLKGWTCSVDGGTAATVNGSVTVALGHSTVCTATNSTAHLRLFKIVENGSDAPAAFTLTATPTDGSGLSPVSVTGTDAADGKLVQVKPGVSYTVSEDGPSGYDSTFKCLSGNQYVAVEGGVVTTQGETVQSCKFTNTGRTAKLKLYKVVSGADQSLANNWTLTATAGNAVVSYVGGTEADTAFQNVDSGVVYTLGETSSMAGSSEFAGSAWTCTPGAVLTGNTVKLTQGQSATCYITNTLTPKDLTMTKTVKSTTQDAAGNWTVVYDIVVNNPSLVRSVNYNLSDTLAFGSSVSIVSANVTAPVASSWTNPTTTPTKVLATGRALAPNTAETWTVSVVATLANGASFTSPASVSECLGAVGKGAVGFLNTAALTFDGKTIPASACDLPAKPSFSKVGQGAVQNADGSWNVTYLLTVGNSSNKALYYDLDDPAITPPSGVSVVSATVTAEPGTPAAGTLPDIATGTSLAAGTTHVYKVVLTVSVSPDTTAASLDCRNEGKGIINSATVTSGMQLIPGSDCVTVTPPKVTHTKTVTSTTQNADGSWTIVYSIVVTNEGTVSGSYSLTDELRFGAGVTVASASATGPSGPIVIWPTSNVLATNALIASGANDSYTVTATTQTLPAGFVGSAAADCLKQTDPLETGTGFWNAASLTSSGATVEKSACSSPSLPKLDKTFVSAIQAADGSWNVSYTLNVTNPSLAGGPNNTLFYTLNDAPAFPSGVTVNSTTVTRTLPAPVTSVTLPVTSEQIATDATHSYTVVINADVPPGAVTPEQTKCKSAENPNGVGFLNVATLTSGADSMTAKDCGPITEGVVPTITKAVAAGYPQQQADGRWLVRYIVTVTNPSATLTSSYSLTDSLTFGGGIAIAASPAPSVTSGAGDPTPQSDWNGTSQTSVVGKTTLAPSGKDVYTIDVVASVAKGVAGSPSADCTITPPETGTGFLNTAVLTSGSSTTPVSACAPPAKVTVTKTATNAVQDGAGWKITYLVTAANNSGTTAALYNLNDTLGFASNVAVTSATVANTVPGSIATSPTWNGVGDTAIVTGQAIAAGASHSYLVTVKATVGSTVADADLNCDGTTGNGFFNTANLTSGSDTPSDSACSSIPVTVKVDKKWVIEGTDFNNGEQPAGFSATMTPIADGPAEWGTVATKAAGSTIEIAESTTVPDGCELTSSDGTGKQTLNKAVNAFTVTNVVDCTQKLTLVKELNVQHGGSATVNDFTLSASDNGAPVFSGAGTASSDAVAHGVVYTISEQGPSGWVVDTDWSCNPTNQGEPQRADSSTGAAAVAKVAGTADVTLGYGEDITCTIVNTDVAPKLILIKKVDPMGTVIPQSWNLFASNPGDERVLEGLGGVIATSVKSNTVYTLGEESAPGFEGGGDFTSPAGWSCGVGDSRTAALGGTVTLNSGETVTCEITNLANAGEPELNKKVLSTVQNADGTWTITYDVSVHNLSSLVGIRYDLTDAPDFGANISIDSLSASGPTATEGDTTGAAITSWDGVSQTVLADDTALAAGATHHYLVTVTATVAAEAWAEGTTECRIGEGGATQGGFLNFANVTSGDYSVSADACDEPGQATAVKAVDGAPVYKGSGQWEINYTITVDNSSDKSLKYDLSDLPKLPAGVSIVSASATNPNGDAVAGWNGTTQTALATAYDIEAGRELPQLWHVTLTVQTKTIEDISTAKCSEHKPQRGLFNSATFTNGTIVTDLDACADLPIATIKLIKKVDNSALEGYEVTPLTSGDWYLKASSGGAGVGNLGDKATVHVIPAGSYSLSEELTTEASKNPIAGDYEAGKWSCTKHGKTVEVKIGTDVVCTITNYATVTDLSIEKSYELEDGATAIEAGDTFNYKLVVTNLGSSEAENIVVTDALPATLERNGAAVFPVGQTWADESTDNALRFTSDGPLAPEATATILIPVKMKEEAATTTTPVDPGVTPELPVVDMSDIENKACVKSWGNDLDESNNCDTVEIPTKRINPAAYVQCVNDIPWLNYNVSTTNVAPGDITVTWTAPDGSVVTDTIPWEERNGKMLWPYGEVNADGISIAWPGWRVEQEGDDTNPNVVDRWMNMVKDTSLASYSFADMVNPTKITFSINPSASVFSVYPSATPACEAERPTELAIVKTASAEVVDIGEAFDYTLSVSNTGLGSATPVTLIDEIPADLKVTAIDTATSPTFPRWEDCAVTGQDSAGYGGTLECELLGMLGRAQTAPNVVLSVMVNPASTATQIDNTGEVCWGESEDVEAPIRCAESEVPVLVKQVAVSGLAQCVNDTPLFSYSVTPENITEQLPIHLIWWTRDAYEARNPALTTAAEILADGASQVDGIAYPAGYQPGDTITGTQLWPGAAVDAAGNATDWPGWTKLPNGRWVLDPNAPFYDLRGETVVEVRINPTSAVTVAYPPATPNCNPNPTNPAEVATASLPSTGFGGATPFAAAVVMLGLGLVVIMMAARRRRGEQS